MDEQLFFLINSNHTPFFDTLMFCISQKTVWVPLYLSLLYVVWKNYSWKGCLYVLLMVGIGMFFTDFCNSQIIRPLIARPRPSDPQSPIAPMVHIVFGKYGHGYGMPSAHSANMWMLTGIVIYWLRDKWTIWTMTLLTLLVCYSRVYLGFHYPGDVVGGFVLAAIVVGGICFWHHKRIVGTFAKGTKVVSAKRRNRIEGTVPMIQWRVTHPAQTWIPTIIAALTIISFFISAAMMA